MIKKRFRFYIFCLVLLQIFVSNYSFSDEDQVTLNLMIHGEKIDIIRAEGRDYGYQLFAMLPGGSQALVSDAWVDFKAQDINQDGNEELLVETSGGGNCCPPNILIYHYDNEERKLKEFIFDEWQAWYGWDEIEIKTDNNKTILSGIKEDARGDKLKHFTTNYIFDGNNIILHSITQKNELPSLIEIRSEDYYIASSQGNLVLEFDINDDGFLDSIACGYWDRWGDLTNCKVSLFNFGIFDLEYSGKRIGILPSIKNEMNMLVINHDTILYFDKVKNNFVTLN